MNQFANIEDFLNNAQQSDTFTTHHNDLMVVDTYTAADDKVERNHRKVTRTSTLVITVTYQTKQTTGLLVLDTNSIPGEALDTMRGGRAVIAGVKPLDGPYSAEHLFAEHRKHLATL